MLASPSTPLCVQCKDLKGRCPKSALPIRSCLGVYWRPRFSVIHATLKARTHELELTKRTVD